MNVSDRLPMFPLNTAEPQVTAQQPRHEQGNLIFDGIPTRDAALSEKLSPVSASLKS